MSRYIAKPMNLKMPKCLIMGRRRARRVTTSGMYERYIKLAWLNISTPFLH
jgi:hypothetical protein